MSPLSNHMRLRARRGGYLMLLALVFGAIFVTLLGALSSYVLVENRLQDVKQSQSEAFSIAEAGIEYYKWYLAHFSASAANGTTTMSYADPEGGTAGSVTLGVSKNVSCGQTTSIDITSTGAPSDNSNVSKTVYARYAQPSVGTYSYILNDSVWAGSDRVINGPYHSNGGIRMDGTTNAPVTSSVVSWTCTDDFGCTANAHGVYPTEPGVFGSGTNSNLWSYPVPQVDFGAISADFNSLKTTANASGEYFTTGTKSSPSNGIHLIFNSNGTVTVKKVTATTNPSIGAFVDGTTATRTSTDYSIIKTESTVGTYTLPATCGLIFVENRAWIEGTITGKVTVVVADVTDANGTADAIIPNNITYSKTDGSVGLTLVAQNDVLIGPTSPTNMTLDGIFIAQGGAFGRNLYGTINILGGYQGCTSTYEPKGTLSILGTTVSNKRTGTKWINGCITSDAGYQTRTDSYDRHMASNPPPFTPLVSTDYELLDWHEN